MTLGGIKIYTQITKTNPLPANPQTKKTHSSEMRKLYLNEDFLLIRKHHEE